MATRKREPSSVRSGLSLVSSLSVLSMSICLQCSRHVAAWRDYEINCHLYRIHSAQLPNARQGFFQAVVSGQIAALDCFVTEATLETCASAGH